MSYRHDISATGIFGTLEYALRNASQEIEVVGPAASIGRGFYSWDNPPYEVSFYIHARGGGMCWSYFRDVILALQQLLMWFGAIEMVYLVNDRDYGGIGLGTFEAINGSPI